MSDRASRFARKKQQQSKGTKTTNPILVAYVGRTPKGKIRLKRIGIRFQGAREEIVSEVPADDARYAFENDYKVRKATHELVKKSPKFSRYYDSSARVFYGEE